MLASGGVGDALAFVVKERTVVAAARLYPALPSARRFLHSLSGLVQLGEQVREVVGLEIGVGEVARRIGGPGGAAVGDELPARRALALESRAEWTLARAGVALTRV